MQPGSGVAAGTAGGSALADQQEQQDQQDQRELRELLQQKQQSHYEEDSADDGNGNSADERSDGDDAEEIRDASSRGLKRKRPISVSCELCKQRKVKCDRGQPSCGWCSRNGAVCEYKERKKPGLRAGYGRELEARLDKLEAILRCHSEVLQIPFDANGQSSFLASQHHQSRGNHASRASEDRMALHEQPQQHSSAAALFTRVDSGNTPQAEAALFLQRPSTGSFSAGPTAVGNGGTGGGNVTGSAGALELGITPSASSITSGTAYGIGPRPVASISPSHQSHHSQQSPLSASAAREFYGPALVSQQQQQQQQQQHSYQQQHPPHHLHHPPHHHLSPKAATSAAGGSPPILAPSNDQEQDLPPYDLTYALVDLYFKHINTWCPLLQRSPTIEALFGPAMTEETNRILLHAIVVATLRFSTDMRLTDEKRQRYHDVSKQRVILYGMEHSSVKALQAMVILALDLCGSSNGPPGWNIMALITRAVVQLGLSVESNSFSISPSYTSIYTLRARILPEPRHFIEEESRRRLFWVVYLLDRYATIATAFEFALDDRDIDRMLPCRDDLWARNQLVETRLFHTERSAGSSAYQSEFAEAAAAAASDSGPGGERLRLLQGHPENLGAFSYYIEILGILTRIHNFLKLPVDISSLGDVEQWQMRYRELDQMLTNWKVGLPAEYGNMSRMFQPNCAKTLSCGWVMLHTTYHTAVMRLHSSAAYPTTRSPIFTPSFSASQRCHSAVEAIATLTGFIVGGTTSGSGNGAGDSITNTTNNAANSLGTINAISPNFNASNGLLLKLGPPFAFSLWVAARLLLVHGSTVEHKLSTRLPFFVEVLRVMGRYWPVADRYCALLQRVLDEHSDSERQGNGVTPSSVRILADMRRTAFDLDLLISRQPRHLAGGGMGVDAAGGGELGAGLGSVAVAATLGNCDAQSTIPQASNHTFSRLPSITPARTPQPNELEYLDVFDFFNMPRLPFAMGNENNNGNMNGNGNGNGSVHGYGPIESTNGSRNTAASGDGRIGAPFPNEFNITDFMVDASQDWLFKQEDDGKFLN